jgi:hypothetical protein
MNCKIGKKFKVKKVVGSKKRSDRFKFKDRYVVMFLNKNQENGAEFEN